MNVPAQDIDLPGSLADHRIVVAMSGGVDSSVTAALLTELGFEVVGITLQLYDHGAAIGRKGACCAGQDINDAAQGPPPTFLRLQEARGPAQSPK